MLQTTRKNNNKKSKVRIAASVFMLIITVFLVAVGIEGIVEFYGDLKNGAWALVGIWIIACFASPFVLSGVLYTVIESVTQGVFPLEIISCIFMNIALISLFIVSLAL